MYIHIYNSVLASHMHFDMDVSATLSQESLARLVQTQRKPSLIRSGAGEAVNPPAAASDVAQQCDAVTVIVRLL